MVQLPVLEAGIMKWLLLQAELVGAVCACVRVRVRVCAFRCAEKEKIRVFIVVSLL